MMQRHQQQQLIVEAAGALVYASKAGPEALQVCWRGGGHWLVIAASFYGCSRWHDSTAQQHRLCRLIVGVSHRWFQASALGI